jgi:hypothetical protein
MKEVDLGIPSRCNSPVIRDLHLRFSLDERVRPPTVRTRLLRLQSRREVVTISFRGVAARNGRGSALIQSAITNAPSLRLQAIR